MYLNITQNISDKTFKLYLLQINKLRVKLLMPCQYYQIS